MRKIFSYDLQQARSKQAAYKEKKLLEIEQTKERLKSLGSSFFSNGAFLLGLIKKALERKK